MKAKILVYTDCMGSSEDIPRLKKIFSKVKNISYKITDNPQEYRGENILGSDYVFVDFGGLLMPGNSLFNSFCCEWDKIIEEHPSIYFIFFSVMRKEFYEDDMYNINKPNVIFVGGISDLDDNGVELILNRYK